MFFYVQEWGERRILPLFVDISKYGEKGNGREFFFVTSYMGKSLSLQVILWDISGNDSLSLSLLNAVERYVKNFSYEEKLFAMYDILTYISLMSEFSDILKKEVNESWGWWRITSPMYQKYLHDKMRG